MSLRQVRFGDFELHPAQACLLRRGRKLKLQPQPFRVLAYLISRSPAVVTREELGEHIWEAGVHVDLDQSLNYCVRQIRQALDDSAMTPRYVETLPRQGYRFICPVDVCPDPPLPGTPEPRQTTEGEDLLVSGSTPDAHALPEPSTAVQAPAAEPSAAGSHVWKGQALLPATLVLAALLLGAVGYSLHSSSRPPHIRSLAVLPLDNLSGDETQEYLADGMTDELTTMLARESTLRIVSRTSVMQYKKAHRPLPELARALGVDAVVEGSVARTGTRMHVTLQLIRADTDSHLWAESYDRDVNDATIPYAAAQSIASQLHQAAHSVDAPRFIAPAAHELYLRARYLWPTDRMLESGPLFRRATEIQPDYAEAWAGLANYYGEAIAGGALDPRTSMHLEEEAAQRSLALAPNLALAHAAVGAAYLIDRWDWANADREILLAISLDPNDAETYYLRANLLEAVKRIPEAIQMEQRSMEMDPYERRDGLASIYLYARLYDEALAEIRLRMEAAPNDPILLYTAKEIWRCKGNYKEAIEAWAKWHMVTGDPGAAAELRHAYEREGRNGFVRWQLKRRLLQGRTQYVSPIELASYYAQLGEREHALALLEEGYRQHSTDFIWISDDPAYDFLHADARYKALVGKLPPP